MRVEGRRATHFEPVVVLVLEGMVPVGGQVALEEFLAEASSYYEEPGGIRVRLEWEREDTRRFREIIEYESVGVSRLMMSGAEVTLGCESTWPAGAGCWKATLR